MMHRTKKATTKTMGLLLAAVLPAAAGWLDVACEAQSIAAGDLVAGDLVRIDHRIVVHSPVERVWEAITTPEGLSRWIAPEAKVELRLEGAYELYFRPDHPEDRGMEGTRVLSFVPLEMLSYTGEAENSWVVWRIAELDSEDGGVEVRFTALGTGKEWVDRAKYFDDAMPGVLDRLAASVVSPGGDVQK